MNTEQERADFEAFASQHGLCVTEDGDLYRSHVVAWMWKSWQARAALQSQDREDAERYRVLRRALRPDGFTVLVNGYDLCTQKLDEAIDHARRVEGDGNG